MEKLTGRTRFRHGKIGLFGSAVLVLQVEEHRTEGQPDWDGLPEHLETTCWRDATVMDLSQSIDAARVKK